MFLSLDVVQQHVAHCPKVIFEVPVPSNCQQSYARDHEAAQVKYSISDISCRVGHKTLRTAFLNIRVIVELYCNRNFFLAKFNCFFPFSIQMIVVNF